MDLPPYISENVQLAPLTTFGIGGPARWFSAPSTREEVEDTLALASLLGVHVLVLGGGSNLLIADTGVEAMVMKLADGGEFSSIDVDADDGLFWRVGAAVSLQALVGATARKGVEGLERMAGIPGRVGGAVAMNAGGAKEGIGGFVVAAEVCDFQGVRRNMEPPELAFSYRRSSVRGMIALGFSLRFAEKREPSRVMERMREYRERKRAAQPLAIPSAGCLFKNPMGDSAGALLDQAGCKGMREGDAEVSRVHANFVVNTGRCSSGDVARLAFRMRRAVWEKSGIDLEPEVATWGKDGAFDRLFEPLV